MPPRKLQPPLPDSVLNQIRGKALVEKASKGEILAVFAHLDYLTDRLDAEAGDAFGTEGWRHGLLGFDA